jgi:hypothetical protein
VVCRPKVVLIKTNIAYFPFEVQEMLHEFSDIVVDDLPNELQLKRSISHHIEFILGASLPNKVAYKVTPKENKEIRNKVQGLLDKAMI